MKKRANVTKFVSLVAIVVLFVCGCSRTNNRDTVSLPLTSGDVVAVTYDGGWNFNVDKKILSKDGKVVTIGFVSSDNYDDNLDLFKRYKNQGVNTVVGVDPSGNKYVESTNSVSAFRLAWINGSGTGYIMRADSNCIDGFSHISFKTEKTKKNIDKSSSLDVFS